MSSWYSVFLFLLACCCMLWLGGCQTEKPDTISRYHAFSKIDSLLVTSSVRPFSGVILVTTGEEVLYFTGSGLGLDQQTVEFTPETSFVIGSISKQVTATLVVREAQRGNLNLDWRIGAYLPRLSPGWKDTVTVRQLLNHTHGIIDRKQALAFAPGTSFAYSNLGYQLLSEILEATTGETYTELVNDLFASLGMFHSTADKTTVTNLVDGFAATPTSELSKDTTTFNGSFLPAAYLISSAGDLTIWNEALHNGGILDSLAYRQMITPSARQDHSLFGEVGYGYGLRVSDRDKLTEIGHTGYANGFVSLNLYYPESGTSLIVLENLDWRAEDIGATFSFEMGVREVVRNYLIK